jgi:nucleotide-binding universal stress UspA family protein
LQQRIQSKREISQVLQVGLATVNRDISYLRNQAKANIKKYIDERLPDEYEKAKDKQVDTIVVGNKGLNTAEELLEGSVSHKISHHAKCSVVIVR